MNREVRIAIRVLRAACGGFALSAVITAIVNTTDVADFFSYFTIQSNLLAIVVLLIGGIVDPTSPRWSAIRGAVTLYMTITGIVYAVLLANETVGLAPEWIDTVLHRVTPLVLLFDWMLFAPWPRLAHRVSLGWLFYPVLYFTYSLIRGPIADFYPYPFIDPRRDGGYGRVVLYALVLAAVMAALAVGVNAIAHWRRSSAITTAEPAGGSTSRHM